MGASTWGDSGRRPRRVAPTLPVGDSGGVVEEVSDGNFFICVGGVLDVEEVEVVGNGTPMLSFSCSWSWRMAVAVNTFVMDHHL